MQGPRIKKHDKLWECSGLGAVGMGATKRAAYKDWYYKVDVIVASQAAQLLILEKELIQYKLEITILII